MENNNKLSVENQAEETKKLSLEESTSIELNHLKLFDELSFSDLLRKIYSNSIEKSSSIDKLLQILLDKIHDIQDAAIFAPIIKDYLDISVKNDENLIKMANVVSRVFNSKERNLRLERMNEISEVTLSEKEKTELLNLIKNNPKNFELPDAFSFDKSKLTLDKVEDYEDNETEEMSYYIEKRIKDNFNLNLLKENQSLKAEADEYFKEKFEKEDLSDFNISIEEIDKIKQELLNLKNKRHNE